MPEASARPTEAEILAVLMAMPSGSLGREQQRILSGDSARGARRPGFALPACSNSPRFRSNDPRGEFADSISNGPENWNRIVIR
jgi:hypothetical protein